MHYFSTNDKTSAQSLQYAVYNGFAPDGGLFMPDSIPTLPQAFIKNMGGMTLQDISYAVANYALQGDIEADVLRNIIYDTLNFDIPLSYISANNYVLELFHGPTFSFKDIGARFLARLLAHYQAKRHDSRPLNIIAATSGNTGSAVAHGFAGIPGVRVYLLYPSGRINPIQEALFTTLGGNVTAIEVNGSRDDCRMLARQAFADEELNAAMHITSATSANVARLIPQMFYYFYAFAQLQQRGLDTSSVVMAVPCGNLGNLTSGLLAKAMGLPIKRFVAACNANNTFADYLYTGIFAPKPTKSTFTPAMDVDVPRNFPRIAHLLGSSTISTECLHPHTVTDDDTAQTIQDTYASEGYLLDPHSATAYHAMLTDIAPNETGIALATAHPIKYKATVEHAIHATIPVPERLQSYVNTPKQTVQINSGYNSLRKFLLTQPQH